MRCALAVFLACLLLASLSAQASSTPSTGSPLEASAAPSSQPVPTWDQLDEIWNQLEQSGQTSSTDLAALKASLSQARRLSTTLSAQLVASTTRARELSSSLEQADSSLQASERSLQEANRLASRHSLALGLWRVGALSSIAGLAGTALEGRLGQGTAWGAGIGAIAGGVWYLAEHWPPWNISPK